MFLRVFGNADMCMESEANPIRRPIGTECNFTSSVELDVHIQFVAAISNVLATSVNVQGQQPPPIVFLIEHPKIEYQNLVM